MNTTLPYLGYSNISFKIINIFFNKYFEVNFLYFCYGQNHLKHFKCVTFATHKQRMDGHVLFNDALNTFYLWLHGVRHMVKDHSDSKRGNLLPPHGLLFPISSKGSFICIIPQTG